jgi:hypothetical protein
LPDQQIEDGTTRATAHLPGLDIEIVHRRSPGAEAEQISINLQAVPSFEAFGRFLETTNPFALWAQAAQLALFPWLGAASALMVPLSGTPKLGSEEGGIRELNFEEPGPATLP